jgi:hypothetical protein
MGNYSGCLDCSLLGVRFAKLSPACKPGKPFNLNTYRLST